MPETDVVAPEDLNKAERSLWDALPGGSPRLGLACRVPPSGQLVSRREEALLQVCVSMLPRARLTGCAVAAFRLFWHPGCGVHDQRVPQRRRPWRSAGQDFSEMAAWATRAPRCCG